MADFPYAYSKRGIPRGALPDAEDERHIYLFKNVSSLRATYQIRLLAFLAGSRGKTLLLCIPQRCVPDASILDLIADARGSVRLKRTGS
jgi:hypothetical protein